MRVLENFFKLKEHDTDVRTELLAGLTTFLTMAYIIFVNPTILADAGMPRDAVFVATCLAAALGSAIMGLYANYPTTRASRCPRTPTPATCCAGSARPATEPASPPPAAWCVPRGRRRSCAGTSFSPSRSSRTPATA